jgi:hypothetical protein
VRRPTRTTAIRVAVMIGLVVIGRSLPARSRTSAPPPAAAPTTGIMAREAPRTAASRILAAYASYPARDPAEVEKSMRDLASAAAAERLAADLHADLARLAAGYPGGATRVWAGPLAVRETTVAENRRREEVWFARVVAPPGRDVYVESRLATLGLVWERDRWRLDTFDETAGPRPGATPGGVDPPAAFVAALSGFIAEGT